MTDNNPYKTPRSTSKNLGVGESPINKKLIALAILIILVTPWLTRAANSFFYPRLSKEEVEILGRLVLAVFALSPIASSAIYCLAYDSKKKRAGRFFLWLTGSSVFLLLYTGFLITHFKE